MRKNVINLILCLFIIVVLGLTGCGGGSGSDTGRDTGSTSYLPLTVGNTWTYRQPDNSTFTQEIQQDGRLKSVFPPTSENGNYKTTYYSTFSTDSTGIIMTGSETNIYRNDQQITIDDSASATYQQPYLLFPFNLTTGAETTNYWSSTGTPSHYIALPPTSSGSVKMTVIGYESITVASGTFNAVKILIEAAQSGVTDATKMQRGYRWFAPGVGHIKTTDLNGTSITELISYSVH